MARKCRYCKAELPKVKDCTEPVQKKGFCSFDHMAKHGLEKAKQVKERERKKEEKAERARLRERKKEVKPKKYWFDRLQILVNQYIVHVRDKDEPCCTCGTQKPDIKYDAGHCFTRAARSDIRFELTNIHKQCSVQCNQYKSGAQEIHKKFIADKYGTDHLEKLEARHKWPSLNEAFPDNKAIELECIRFRKILRDNGVIPQQ